MEFKHYSVLLEETIDGLQIKADGTYVDGTLGGGGHAYHVCQRLENGHFYGIDQDAAAIEAAGKRLEEFGDMVTIVRSNYCNMKEIMKEQGVDGVDGIVLDLGVSSYQLDTIERGFSYKYDTDLDMRMDQRQTLTAKEIVNQYFPTCPNISIDYAVMEKSKEVFVYPASFGWSDLGTWGSLYTHLDQDEDKNAAVGQNINLVDCKNCVVHTPSERKVVIQGLDNYIIAESDNTLLICRKEDEQKIKDWQK